MALTHSEENKEDSKKDYKWKPKYKAQYSMGELDYIRYDSLLKFCDELRIIINCRSTQASRDQAYDAIEPYYATLDTVYVNWRQLILDLNKFDELFKEVDKAIIDWRKQGGNKQFPETLAEKLKFIHKELLGIKQIIGLGINLQKDEKFTTKARRALLGNI